MNIQQILQKFDKQVAHVFIPINKKENIAVLFGKIIWNGGLIYTVKAGNSNFSLTFDVEDVNTCKAISRNLININLK